MTSIGSLLRIAALAAALSLAACGGCPWLTRSSVTIAPAQTCLMLQVADTSGNAPSTGCVNPVLYGENDCTVALSLPPSAALNQEPLEIAPGRAFSYEFALNQGVKNGRQFTFTVTATLGSDPIQISFQTQH